VLESDLFGLSREPHIEKWSDVCRSQELFECISNEELAQRLNRKECTLSEVVAIAAVQYIIFIEKQFNMHTWSLAHAQTHLSVIFSKS